MAEIDTAIEMKARKALDFLSAKLKIVAAYLFGSHVDGTADQWSDIDIAVFAEGVENWDITKRAKTMADVMEVAGDDVEIHFFSAESLTHRDPASFAAWVLKHGVELSL
jgi:predicted nucleotidyltransferase